MDDSVTDSNIPPPSTGKAETKSRPPGKVIYGEDLTFKGGSHATTLQIIGPAAADMKSRLPDVPKSPSNHFKDFLLACQGQEKCRSSFSVAGPLCHAMAIGIISQRVNDKLTFDPATRQITNHRMANELLRGAPLRQGCAQFYKL